MDGFWDRHRLPVRVRMWTILVAIAFLLSGCITLASEASGGKYLLIIGAVLWIVEFIVDKIPSRGHGDEWTDITADDESDASAR